MNEEKRAQWLADRRTGLGGSDAAAACGLSKWKTPLELFLDKTGQFETVENESMAWGNKLEPVVRQEYANRTGRTVVVPEGIIRHPSVPFALMTPDGIADGNRVLQVKTARTSDGWGTPGSGEIPQEYILQTQHEMFVTELRVADVAVLIGGSDFRIYVIEADPELQGMLIDQEREFWRCVQAGRAPEPVNAADVKRRWQFSTATKAPAGVDEVAACKLLAEWKARYSLYENGIEQLTALLQSQMRDAAELVSDGGEVLATWKNVHTNPRFDLDRFRADQPDLYRQYLRDAASQRRFLLKVKGPAKCLPLQVPNLNPALEMATAPLS